MAPCVIFGDTPALLHENFHAMEAVYDACRNCSMGSIPCTLLIDPIWVERYDNNGNQVSDYPYAVDREMNNLRRKGINGWLVGSYRYFFFSGHGSLSDYKDGTHESEVVFCNPVGGAIWVYGNNYGVTNRKNLHLYPAFSDAEINPSQYRIVQINTCYSGGAITENYVNTEIPQAFFGTGDLSGTGQVLLRLGQLVLARSTNKWVGVDRRLLGEPCYRIQCLGSRITSYGAVRWFPDTHGQWGRLRD